MGLFERLGKGMTWLFTPTRSQQPETQSGLGKAINWLFTPTGSQQKLQINTNPISSQPVEIPANASHRINSQKQVGANFFTSDLSCNEYLLTRQAGWEPIGVVMGTCFYKVGFFGYRRNNSSRNFK